METDFKTIALIGKPDHQGANQTLVALYRYLSGLGLNVVIEHRVGEQLGLAQAELLEMVELGERADLAIVVGGDGNMLGSARVLSRFDVAVVGVNRGNLGFLTDLSPDSFEQPLERLLSGDYQTEHRFLLEAQVHRHGQLKASNTAMNEAVLHPGKIAHMIEFEVYINGHFMYSQRADGMIVATPTGSTAYSLCRRPHPHPQSQCHYPGAHVPPYPELPAHRDRRRRPGKNGAVPCQQERAHAGQL